MLVMTELVYQVNSAEIPHGVCPLAFGLSELSVGPTVLTGCVQAIGEQG